MNALFTQKPKPSQTWSTHKDKILLEKVSQDNKKNWSLIAQFLPDRTAIQYSARYYRIRPGIKKGLWSKEERINNCLNT